MKKAPAGPGQEGGSNVLGRTAHDEMGLCCPADRLAAGRRGRMHGSGVDLHVAKWAALSSEEPGEKQCDQHAGEYAGDKAEPEVMPKIHPEQFAVLGEGVQRGLREGNALWAVDERIFAD